jgi:hypothetical protein
MVRLNLFLASLLLWTCGFSQTSFSVYSLKTEDENLSYEISKFSRAKDPSSRLGRSPQIDSVALERTDYFISLLSESYDDFDFSSLLGLIPVGKKAHQQFFGRPDVFTEPAGVQYPKNLVFVPSINLKLKAEIMQQAYFSLLTAKKIDSKEIAERALDGFKTDLGNDFMLKSYRKSEDHLRAIILYGKNKMGTSTKALVAKTWVLEKKKWKYEVVIYNVVLFSE